MQEKLNIPELSLVMMIGTSGSGKSTFANTHFKSTEVISSDSCRGMVSDDENNQKVTKDAFELLHYIAAKRLKNGLLTVIDATNVQLDARKKLINLAREYHCLPVAIVLNLPPAICQKRNELRSDRKFGKHVINQQNSQLRRSLKKLKREGFRKVIVLESEEEINAIKSISREKLYNNRKELEGPFDIIGDIHGCFDETVLLLKKLGYHLETDHSDTMYGYQVSHPENRKVIFLGDLVDRGPNSPAVLKLVMDMVSTEVALCVPGNHDIKLHKFLTGKRVQLKHGLEITIAQLKNEPEQFKTALEGFLYGLTSHYVLDKGKLVVAHAGIKEDMQGRGSGAVSSFCLFGETTGETDEFGLPIRYNWASEYKGNAMVVYGHTAVPVPEWLNNTIDIDTGCVFGGKLTALRYPEKELISIPANEVYCEPVKPILSFEADLTNQQENDDLLAIDDLIGKQIINTKLMGNVTIREENSINALEIMSRFAVNPKWLIYLPPTMSPSGTSELPDYLEHPLEALSYFKKENVYQVIAEQKHMGSRAILVVCRNKEVVKNRFGIIGEGIGKCFTRTGRNFFNDLELEQAFIKRLNNALTESSFWENMDTDWVCLDAELMPWSAKAQSLIKDQYASVGVAANMSIEMSLSALDTNRDIDGLEELERKFKLKKAAVSGYNEIYANYCWEVNGLDDYQLAPFHILATEGNVHVDKTHEWHMETISKVSCVDPKFIINTPYKIVNLLEQKSMDEMVDWWMQLTGEGGEGVVVKPINYLEQGKNGLVQPAIKCRGKEYLRIIYGPEYTLEENMKRLKNRGLSRKRGLALREFSLGIEALNYFVENAPLRKVHQCVFGVLAFESEPVDPRL